MNSAFLFKCYLGKQLLTSLLVDLKIEGRLIKHIVGLLLLHKFILHHKTSLTLCSKLVLWQTSFYLYRGNAG